MKPILFNTEMVWAILDGKKTATRRIVRKKYSNTDLMMFTNKYGTRLIEQQNDAPKPIEFIGEDGMKRTRRSLIAYVECKLPYQPGDILYVRETFAKNCCGTGWPWLYKASPEYNEYEPDVWHPSIHMPKEAARIFLRVTDVHAERLQDITEDGAKAEGAINNHGFIHSPDNEYDTVHTAREHFSEIWNSTVKKANQDKYGWDANPWVWVISFEHCEKPKEKQ